MSQGPLFREYIIQLGIPALVIAICFAMTGYLNFWVGIGGTLLALAWIIWDLIHRSRGLGRFVGIGVCLIFAVGVLWLVFRPAPLDVLVIPPTPGTYEEGTEVAGIKWKANYKPVEVNIGNDTDSEYNDLKIYIRTNVPIAGIGIKEDINHCVAKADTPGAKIIFGTVSFKNRDGTVTNMPEGNTVSSTFFRVRCDKLASMSDIYLVIAAIESPPLRSGALSWLTMLARYDGHNRARTLFIRKCFAKGCPDMPKTPDEAERDMKIETRIILPAQND